MLVGVVAVGCSVFLASVSVAAPELRIDSAASIDGLAQATRLGRSPVTCGQGVPADRAYDPFYKFHCDSLGLDVLASAEVDPAAVRRTAEIIVAMIGHRPDLIAEMVAQHVRVAVIGRDELTTDMPEYRNLYELFPGVDWNTRARGLGATPTIPLSSVNEENILCLPNDIWFGGSIMVHEFAHTILTMGLRFLDPAYTRTDRNDPVVDAWVHAVDVGLWENTYAITVPDEYWAETVMAYFDTNVEGPAGGDGIHNDIDTRIELASYDPQIYAVIDGIFGNAAPLNLCNG